jgi:hypothetical protein
MLSVQRTHFYPFEKSYFNIYLSKSLGSTIPSSKYK